MVVCVETPAVLAHASTSFHPYLGGFIVLRWYVVPTLGKFGAWNQFDGGFIYRKWS
jgi:hypothetical protein